MCWPTFRADCGTLPVPGANCAVALGGPWWPSVAVWGKVMKIPTHLRSLYCLQEDGWCQEGKGGASRACEKAGESFHLPEYFRQWTLIILLAWAGKEANFGSLHDPGSAFFAA